MNSPLLPAFNHRRSSSAFSSQFQITGVEPQDPTGEASDAASTNAPAVTALQASVAPPAMPAAPGMGMAASSHTLAPTGQPPATKESASSHDSSSTVQQQQDSCLEDDSPPASVVDKPPAHAGPFQSSSSAQVAGDRQMPSTDPLCATGANDSKTLAQRTPARLLDIPTMTQQMSHPDGPMDGSPRALHEDEAEGSDIPPGLSASPEILKAEGSQQSSARGSFLRGALGTSLPHTLLAPTASQEQLSPSSTQHEDEGFNQAQLSSPPVDEKAGIGSEALQSPSNSGERAKPQEAGPDPNRVLLLQRYPTRAGKADFDYCSVRVQPFPDRFTRDDIHEICFKFGKEIGPVKAVWSGLGTRSGRPYGKPPPPPPGGP